MTVNNELHEMENQVTKGAKAAEPMPKAPNYVPDAGAIEDLGGPTPQNSRPEGDSNKLKTPSGSYIGTATLLLRVLRKFNYLVLLLSRAVVMVRVLTKKSNPKRKS